MSSENHCLLLSEIGAFILKISGGLGGAVLCLPGIFTIAGDYVRHRHAYACLLNSSSFCRTFLYVNTIFCVGCVTDLWGLVRDRLQMLTEVGP